MSQPEVCQLYNSVMTIPKDSRAIPIINFSGFISGTLEERLKVANDLVSACRNVGFVNIGEHGLSLELLQEAFVWSKKLYGLSHEDKMKAPHPSGPSIHRGYSPPGLEKVSNEIGEDDELQSRAKTLREITDYKESYEIGSEDNVEQPNVWLPDDILPGYRSFMTHFYWECSKTARTILKAIALGLGLEEDTSNLLQFHSGYNNQLRLLHYPPVPAKLLENQTLARMPAHSDWSSMTILFQDDCGGLEIEDPQNRGTFIPATPIKDAVVMNVGDLLQRWTNDYLTSTQHRVTSPPLQDRYTGEERITRERYSIVYFLAPDPDMVVECLPTCIDESNPAKYPPITQRKYGMMRARLHYMQEGNSVPSDDSSV